MRKWILTLCMFVGVLVFGTVSVQAATSNQYGITIDGNFSDWSDKTMTSLKETGDDYNIKKACLLADNDNVYFYLNMSPEHGGGYSTLQPSGYELKVGSKTYWLTWQGVSGLSDGQTKSFTIYAYESDSTGGNVNKTLTQAQAVVHRYKTANGHNDIMEASIPLSELKVSGTTSQSISIANTNLGTQTLTTTGGSTGPILISSVGFLMAIAGVVTYQKRKKVSRLAHE